VIRALAAFAGAVDRLAIRVGEAAAWLYPALVAVLILNVALRYGLGRGLIELEELQWHLCAAAYLLGFAYAYATAEHVRVDLWHARLGPRARAWIELVGVAFLLLPFTAVLTWHAAGFFWQSLAMGERSPMPSGLPARFALKGVLALGVALLALAALAAGARSVAALAGGREER
jgi:TRAP-type mannitol/chloroaromatic compound transport system permease small subunit